MSSRFFTLEELGLRSGDGTHEARVCADDDVSGGPCVLEINDLATLAELQPLWRELFDKTPRAAFSQSFEWLQLYWQHFGTRQRLRVLCLDKDGDTLGLTVFVEQSARGFRELTLPSIGSETLWPLGNKPAEQWRVVAKYLHSELAHKQTLDLRGLPDPDAQIRAALRAANVDVQSQSWSGTTTLRLSQDFESYWSQVSTSLRSQMECAEQRLASLGPTNFVRFRPHGTERTGPRFPDELYHDCLTIALNDERQLARADSVLNAPERHLFLRDLLPWAWRHSAADLCLLLSGSRPIAFRFHTLAFGHLRTVWTGVDAEFRQLPLAALLLFRTLRDSTQRGDVELELGPTTAEVVRDWRATVTPLHRFVVGSAGSFSAIQPPAEYHLNGH